MAGSSSARRTRSDSVSCSPRPFCPRCLKAARACLCRHLVPFETHPQFVFLMHRKELRDRLGTGTGRLAHLLLMGSRLVVGTHFDDEKGFRESLAESRWFPCVLYPGAEAMDISSAEGMSAFQDAKGSRTPLVILLDGSWSCVKSVMRQNPFVSALPRISFSTGRTSAYGFKRQPRAECLSTLEAVHELLSIFDAAGLESARPKGAQKHLLAVFERLVEFQKGFSPEGSPGDPGPAWRG